MAAPIAFSCSVAEPVEIHPGATIFAVTPLMGVVDRNRPRQPYQLPLPRDRRRLLGRPSPDPTPNHVDDPPERLLRHGGQRGPGDEEVRVEVAGDRRAPLIVRRESGRRLFFHCPVVAVMPALFTRTSTRPKCSSVSPTSRCAVEESLRSPTKPTAWAPSAISSATRSSMPTTSPRSAAHASVPRLGHRRTRVPVELPAPVTTATGLDTSTVAEQPRISLPP